MPVITPFVYVDPPKVEPYWGGLFDAVDVTPAPDEHVFYGGAEFESLACYQSATYPGGLNDVNGAGGSKVLPACLGVTQASAFAVYGGVTAGSLGHNENGNAYWEQRARRIVELAGQHAVETALWTGSGGGSPALNTAATPLVIGGQANTTVGAVNVLTGLALAEKYLTDNYAGRGMIHLPRAAAPYLAALQQIRPDPDRTRRFMTVLGTQLVFGGGYDGTGPNAVTPPAGTVSARYFWAYATGQVLLHAGPIETPGGYAAALDRAGNQVRLYAEQPWIAAVDCLKAAILIGGGI